MEETKGQLGHFTCPTDLDPSSATKLACHASKSGKFVCIFSPILKMYRHPGRCYLERSHPL
jgi:hypothetical protein